MLNTMKDTGGPALTTLVLAELDDKTSEGERQLYRTLNHYQNALSRPGGILPPVTPIIGCWKGVLARAFAIREDLFRMDAMRELFEKQHSTLVYNTPQGIGYLSDGNDLDAAPLAHVSAVNWSSDRPVVDSWSYFPAHGLYMAAVLR